MDHSKWTRHFFEELPSTQDKAFELSRASPDLVPLVVVTKRQVAGRGRLGNVWVGLSGNFFGSFAVHPDLPLNQTGQFSFLAAVALSDVLEGYLPENCKIEHKWPNDVLVNSKKVAGILIESESDAEGVAKLLVMGVGVNLAEAPNGAISLRDFMTHPPLPEDFLERFLVSLSYQMSKMETEGFSALRADWLFRAKGLGEKIRVRLPHECFEGIFEGLENDGALRIRIEGQKGVRVIRSGEVFFS